MKINLDDFAKFIRSIYLPVIYVGIFSLYAINVLFQLYSIGKLSDGTDKELIGLVSAALAVHSFRGKT